MSDLRLEDHGSVVLLFADTEEGQLWIDDNVEYESWQMLGGGIACEPRMADAVAMGAFSDGLEVSA